MGGRSWNWRKQRVKTDDKAFADEVQVYAEGEEGQPVITLRVVPPKERK